MQLAFFIQTKLTVKSKRAHRFVLNTAMQL